MKYLSSIILIIALSIISLNSYSQDIIYNIDGSKIEAKVEEVGKSEVKYRKFDNTDGPVYVLPKREIMMITYENGSHDIINEKSEEFQLQTDFTRNIISFHLFDLLYNSVTLSYERILGNGTVGIRIPVTVSYGEDDIYNYTRIFGSGIIVNFYPTGQGKWRYFVGPDVQMGVAESSWYDYYNSYSQYKTENCLYTRFLIDNGVSFSPIKNMSVSVLVGLGIRYLAEGDEYESGFNTDGQFSFNLSYRF